MRQSPGFPKLNTLLATTSLVVLTSLSAAAQPAAPAGADVAGEANQDPPALAGRVAVLNGSVSFHANGVTEWSPAALNYPVTTGEAFWTEPKAQAVLEIADDRVVLASTSELDVGELDVTAFTTTLPQGAMFLQLSSLPQGETVTINTPRGAVQINAPGRYEIVAGDTQDATLVCVVEGAAHVTGAGLDLDIGPQQTATIVGSDTLQGAVGPLEQDDFLRAQLRPPVHHGPVAALPPAVQYMTGAADLQTYGSFSQTAQYGQVWYPASVPANWAPYRTGHWAYVSPWGWTWVDNERWGFAPFHYGRWVQVEHRWGWVPGEVTVSAGVHYPVYSPALVAFVGVNAGGVNIGLSASAFAGGYAPAWIPLGPREPYYPWYHVRPAYFAGLNAPYGVPAAIIQRGPVVVNETHVTNVREVNITRTNVYINAGGATAAPAAAFVGGQPMAGVARPLPQAALVNAQPFVGRLPVRPTAATPNLTPIVAHRFNVALPARPAHPLAAGPAIVQPATNGGHQAPVLRAAPPPAGVRPVPVSRVHAPRAPSGLPPAEPHAAGTASPAAPQAPARQEHGPAERVPLRAPGAQRPEAPASGSGTGPAPAGRPESAVPLRAPATPARGAGERPATTEPGKGHAEPERSGRPAAGLPDKAATSEPRTPRQPERAEPEVRRGEAQKPASETHAERPASERHEAPSAPEPRKPRQAGEDHKDPQVGAAHKGPETGSVHKERPAPDSHKERPAPEPHKERPAAEPHKAAPAHEVPHEAAHPSAPHAAATGHGEAEGKKAQDEKAKKHTPN
jgi:hypothetical protein